MPALRNSALVAAAVALVALAATRFGDDDAHELRAVFAEAIQVVPGQEVRLAGRRVGRVASVEEVDGEAVVRLRIDQDDWPLRRGTTARLRFGSVSGYAARFVDLAPGPASQPPLRDGAILDPEQTITPVEFDQLFSTFDRRTRGDLAGVLDLGARTLDHGGAEGLRGVLREGPGGADAYAQLAADLGADPHALRTLLRSGRATTSAIARQLPALRALIRRAAGTFEELATHRDAQRATLDRLPEALRSGRRTLARLDGSMGPLSALVADLRPGAAALRGAAPEVEALTSRLREVAPLTSATLRTGRRAAPSIDALLRAGTPFAPMVAKALDGLAPALHCITPYGPEITGMASTWTGLSGIDPGGGHGRVDLTQLPPTVAAGTVLSSEQITDLFGSRVRYAMPRPPGLDTGQPWFLPECGAGPDALDPSKDPERRKAAG